MLLSRLKPDFKLRRGVEERPILTRMFLHAAALVVPLEPEPVEVHARLPDALEVVLRKLRRFAPRGERP